MNSLRTTYRITHDLATCDALLPLVQLKLPAGTERVVRGFVDEEVNIGNPSVEVAQRGIFPHDERPGHRRGPRLLSVRKPYNRRIRWRFDAGGGPVSATLLFREPFHHGTHRDHLGYSNG
jgi:hypothetical protein